MRPTVVFVVAICALATSSLRAATDERTEFARDFRDTILPFIANYCLDCHRGADAEAKFDLTPYASLDSVARDMGHWQLVLGRLQSGEMPPEDASTQPDVTQRTRVIAWIERLRRYEALRNAGDPGPVLARRLSNAEYDYTIRDLTGVDIRPTREFPVDPANEAGFDNSGESLTMSPALLNKYLAAAREVADHLVLLPDGLSFAPHPVVTYSDRDKFAVHRIVEFYDRQPTDYADYFEAAWRYHHRAKLGTPDASLEEIAQAQRISGKYLATVWSLLIDSADQAGPIAKLREKWTSLPEPSEQAERQAVELRAACEELREFVLAARKDYIPPVGEFEVKGLNKSNQPLILWKNRSIAANRRLGRVPDDAKDDKQLRAAVDRFCDVFPDTFFVSERGRMFLPPSEQEKGRLLSAGFHLMVGYFRDDAPLYDLILDQQQQRELDQLWRELDFITEAPKRQFSDFVYFERAEFPGFLKSAEFDFARENPEITSAENLGRFAELYVARARSAELAEPVVEVIAAYFQQISANIRRLEQSQADAESTHLEALLSLTERAWRRPLAETEQRELREFYEDLREQQGLSHDEALRDVLVSVLMSPRFEYRTTASAPGSQAVALTDCELANRLSYFLWSSLPDAELSAHAAAGDLHEPDVLIGQTRRMLRDPPAVRLATEFGGHWLEFRRFESHNGVNRDRFPMFTSELRQAMYEEPIRFFSDLVARDGSILEFLEAHHTFVNPVLAAHYGIPHPGGNAKPWVRIDDAERHGRGGLLPMSIFLTQNSPGLRTSPVKRGYWVVRRLLGEQIPAPPPEVPDLPEDEAALGELSLREVLAKHREVASCATCHRRFDSIGLSFEGYGPVGERRSVDLGGRAVDTAAVFPDGSEGVGLDGLKQYLLESRRTEFVENFCRKLFAYALGRSLLLSDEPTIEHMRERLGANDHRFSVLVETIVTSPQFLRKRGRDFASIQN